MSNTKMTHAEVFAEVRWLLDNGMSPEETAAALNRTMIGIEVMARRHGDIELHRIFNRAIKRSQRFAA